MLLFSHIVVAKPTSSVFCSTTAKKHRTFMNTDSNSHLKGTTRKVIWNNIRQWFHNKPKKKMLTKKMLKLMKHTRKLSKAMWMNERNKQNQNHRRCLWILTHIHIHKNCDGNCERIVSLSMQRQMYYMKGNCHRKWKSIFF